MAAGLRRGSAWGFSDHFCDLCAALGILLFQGPAFFFTFKPFEAFKPQTMITFFPLRKSDREVGFKFWPTLTRLER